MRNLFVMFVINGGLFPFTPDVSLFKNYYHRSHLLPRNFSSSGKSQLPTESRWTRRVSEYCIQGTSPCCHRIHLLNEVIRSWLLRSCLTPCMILSQAYLPFICHLVLLRYFKRRNNKNILSSVNSVVVVVSPLVDSLGRLAGRISICVPDAVGKFICVRYLYVTARCC